MNHGQAALLIAAIVGLLVSGCAQQAPRISHVHVGHAITGWHDTPGQQGLLVTAQEKGRSALQHARDANAPGQSLAQVQASLRRVMLDVDPGASTERGTERYGLTQALRGAIDHMAFAAEVDDASQNVRTATPAFVGNASSVLARCESLLVFAREAVASTNPQEVKVLAGEILWMALAIADGVDVDGNGVIGSKREEYGLAQLKRDLVAMTEREDPPYTTVSTWYLFNLIRLPGGNWVFKDRPPATVAPLGRY